MINVHAVGINDKIYKKSQFLKKFQKYFFLEKMAIFTIAPPRGAFKK